MNVIIGYSILILIICLISAMLIKDLGFVGFIKDVSFAIVISFLIVLSIVFIKGE